MKDIVFLGLEEELFVDVQLSAYPSTTEDEEPVQSLRANRYKYD